VKALPRHAGTNLVDDVATSETKRRRLVARFVPSPAAAGSPAGLVMNDGDGTGRWHRTELK
jgi:hypothetical protein